MDKSVLQIDPRQALATNYYKDPSSDTFANLKQSMIKAGYSEVYADKNAKACIKWIANARNTVEMIQGSERNLKKVIEKDIDIDDDNISKSKLELLKIQQGASQFVLKTLANKKYNDNQDKQDTPQISVNIIKQYNITNNGAPSTAHDVPDDKYQDATTIDPLTQ